MQGTTQKDSMGVFVECGLNEKAFDSSLGVRYCLETGFLWYIGKICGIIKIWFSSGLELAF